MPQDEVAVSFARHRWPVVDPPEWQRYADSVCQLMLLGLLIALYLTPTNPSKIWVAVGVMVLLFCFEAWKWHQNRGVRNGRSFLRGDDASGSPSIPDARLVVVGESAEVQNVLEAEAQWTDPFIVRERPRFSNVSVIRSSELLKIAVATGIAATVCSSWVMEPARFLLVFLPTKFCLDCIHNSIRPTYLRIGAGWLERITFGMWRRQGRIEVFVPLLEARIVCRFDERRLYIFPPRDRDRGIGDRGGGVSDWNVCIDLRETPEPHAFVRALFQAARSAQLAPRLPLCVLAG